MYISELPIVDCDLRLYKKNGGNSVLPCHGLLVHPEYTEYIPIHYFHPFLYALQPDRSVKISHNVCMYETNRWRNSYNRLTFERFTSGNVIIYGSKTILLESRNIICGLFIKSSYVRKYFDDFINYMLNDSLICRKALDLGMFDTQLQTVASNYFFKTWIDTSIKDNLIVFIKENDLSYGDFIGRNTYANIKESIRFFKEEYIENSFYPRFEVPVIVEEDNDFFLSKAFVEREPYVFEDIEEPITAIIKGIPQ